MNQYDVVIVGGGAVGVGLLRDLALNGSKCLLVDRGDFSSQTSQTSSKMLHGGIRYLENCDFGLVWEALHEKNLWVKQAPHLAKEIPFYLPIYKESKYPLWMTSIGLKFYDFLSGFKNKPHSTLGKKKTLEQVAGIRDEGLRGAGVYYDAVVDDHKLILECLYDALLEKNIDAENYTKIVGITANDQGSTITLEDLITHEKKEVFAKEVIFATGPFTDDLLIKELGLSDWTPKLLLSKGAHIWLKEGALPLDKAMVLQTNDKRLIFVIPQPRGILVGTTETPVKEDMFNIKASVGDEEYLLKNINHYFPKAKVTKEHILSSFAGVRPLVRKGSVNAHKASRFHKVYHYRPNVHVIIGGKYTTFRTMGQKLASQIVARLGKEYDKKKTLAPLRQKSAVIDYKKGVINDKVLVHILSKEKVKTFEDLVVRRLNIPARKHWSEGVDFNEFFKKYLPLMQKYIPVTEKDIESFA